MGELLIRKENDKDDRAQMKEEVMMNKISRYEDMIQAFENDRKRYKSSSVRMNKGTKTLPTIGSVL